MPTIQIDIQSLKQESGEYYGEYCDRLEAVLHELIDSGDTSDRSLEALAYILMEMPSDFNAISYRRARAFFTMQSERTRGLFWHIAMQQERADESKVEYFLSMD